MILKPISWSCVPLLVLLSVLPENISGTDVRPVRRVLIINEVNTSFPGIRIIDDGIRAAFDNSHFKLEVYREYLDTIYFPDEADQQRLRGFYIQKYHDHKPDIIVTVGPSPLEFMSEVHQAAFPGIPIVFCLPHWVPGETLVVGQEITGVENDMAALETVEAAVHLQRGTKHVVVVGGTASVDKQFENVIKKQLSSLNSGLDVSYLTTLAMPELLERLKRLPNQTIVLVSSFSQDSAGAKFISGSESGPMIVAAASAPVFSLSDTSINHGEVGGKVLSLKEQGRIAGDIVLRILGGEKPQDIPRSKAGTTYIFDSRALKRWGFRERDLPPGSIVLNRQPTFWEFYKWYVINGVSLIVLEGLLIFGLLWQRGRAKEAEAELTISYHRLRMAVESGKSVGWDLDVRTGRDHWFGDLQTMFGMASDTFDGTMADFRRRVHPEDQELVSKAFADARLNHKPYVAEFRVLRDDQTVRWITARGEFYYARDGEPIRMLGIATDVTDTKLLEQQVRENEQRLGRRLIEAHEEERTWIARELHDDINQRLALLAVDLTQWSRETSPTNSSESFRHVERRITEISKDVQSLSHRLHSSKLEFLGLGTAAKSFCRELSEKTNVEIRLTESGIPSTLPKEVSLCLFRVLQESLQNALKYSGVRSFRVDLCGTPENIELTVSDDGKGFDEREAFSHHGLGLISMRERMKMVNGIFNVQSQPGLGTTIMARVPLQAAQLRAQAG